MERWPDEDDEDGAVAFSRVRGISLLRAQASEPAVQ